MNQSELEHYKSDIKNRLGGITPLLVNYSMGDFSHEMPVPGKEDEFTELLIGINLMVADLREAFEAKEATISRLEAAEAALTENESKYRLLFDTMPGGWAYHQVIFDENQKPIDYVFLEANKTFERYTGLAVEETLGKKVTVVLPGIENADPDLISLYGKVAVNGEEEVLEVYFAPFEKWYRIRVSSPEFGFFVTVFDDITDRIVIQEKQAENLKALERFNKMAIDREQRMIALKREVNALLLELGRKAKYDLSFAE